MKTVKSIFYGLGVMFLVLFFSSCEDKVKGTETYMTNLPIYMSLDEFRAEKPVLAAQEMKEPGKICMYGDFLLINEIAKGIHIIDNSDPSNPKNVAFLDIIGNVEMSIIGNLLFTDSYKDLVCFDLTNPEKPAIVSRAENVFPYVIPATGNYYPIEPIEEEKGVVIGWEVKKITKDKEFTNPNPGPIYYDNMNALSSSWKSNTGGASKVTAITGSMARFAVNGNYLYAIDKYNYSLKVFLLEGKNVKFVSSNYVNGSMETVFCYNDMLFFGMPNGMQIYSIENPEKPLYLSSISHIMGCDPVVVQDNYAYLTIRMGNFCGQGRSLLDVIDISDVRNPMLTASFDMEEPYGLSIDGNRLFVCDKGLKVFDASNPKTVGSKLLKSFSSMHGYDVISYDNLLMMIGNNGLSQYDYSDSGNIKLLSTISITN